MSDMKDKVKASIAAWYPYSPDGSVLCVYEGTDSLTSLIKDRVASVDHALPDSLPFGNTYDHVVCLTPPERYRDSLQVIRELYSLVKPSGTLLFPMNNRLGIRYFCGDRDPYTDRVFDGIDNYVHADLSTTGCSVGRMFARSEMSDMLHEAGIDRFRFLAVYSGLEYPTHLFSEDYIPNEDLANRMVPTYHCPESVFLEEERLYGSLAANGLLFPMANAYLVECGRKDSCFSDVLCVTCSLDRSRDNSMITTVHSDMTVTKTAVYEEGAKRLEELLRNHSRLRNRGILTVDGNMNGRSINMPFIDAPTGQKYLQELLLTDRERFLEYLDRFMEQIDRSSDIKGTDEVYGPIAETAFIDMVPLNSLIVDGEYVFIDQEYVLKDYPINVVKARVMLTFFSGHDELRFIESELYERYGLLEKKLLYREKEHEFLNDLLSKNQLGVYRSRLQRDIEITVQNRKRMNHHSDFHRRCFEDIFEELEGKELYIFGSGRYAERFIDDYGEELNICEIFDNNSKKWGLNLKNIRITSPEKVKSLERGSFKIVICMRDYNAVIKQLDAYQVLDYCVYDMHRKYKSK